LLSFWDVPTGKPLTAKDNPDGCVAIAASSTGALAIGSVDGSIAVRDELLAKAARRWSGHNNPVRLLAFSPDGSILASSASTDGTVKLWKTADGEPVLVIPEATENCTVEAIAFHPKDKMIAAAGINWLGRSEDDGVIVLWNWEVPCRVRVLPGGASRLAFSPDGKLLFTVGVLNESVVVWDVEKGTIIQELSELDAATNAVAIDPQGRYLASGSDDFGLRIWDVSDWSLIGNEELETSIKDVIFSQDGKAVITGNGNSACYRISLEDLSSSQ
jgi:WD40 repeat protein